MKSITPDGITGSVFVTEGIKNSITLLNAPMGCKFYHSSISQRLMPRPPMYLPAREGEEPSEVNFSNLNDWFFRQGRVPCTWLDSHDYVYGTADKVREALEFIRRNVGFDILCIADSPGASLIGDDLRELCSGIFPDKPTVVLETPGFSADHWDGASAAIEALLVQAGDRLFGSGSGQKHDAPTVNIIGMSLWQKYSEGNIDEIKRILGMCGIKVGCVLCAGCSAEELGNVPEADLNIVLYPEIGTAGALYLRKRFGTECYICDGPPVGFDAVSRFVHDVCGLLGASHEAFDEEMARSRALAWYRINGIHSATGRPNGTLFYVRSIPSEERSYGRFFTEYLGMKQGGPDDAELVFADANTIAELMLSRREFCGIETANPSMGYVDVIPKCTLGIKGALFLTEQVLNGLMTAMV
ncbi:MAG: oxidoreductase [Eubacteriaceae bacterium]|nr:oxidoreductase [Eubacteriaceae bacterium]